MHIISTEDSESDFVILLKLLKFDKHIDNTGNKRNNIMGLIKKKFTYMDKDLLLTLYKSLAKSHLDYDSLAFYPTTKKDKHIHEKAQCRAIRLVHKFRGLTYKECLIELILLHWTTIER